MAPEPQGDSPEETSMISGSGTMTSHDLLISVIFCPGTVMLIAAVHRGRLSCGRKGELYQ